MQQPQPQPAPRTHFRPFPLAFEHSHVITELYNSQVVHADTPWLLLTNDAVIAAVQKHILQICRRYLRDIRSTHIAVQLATVAFHRSFGQVAHAVPLSVARDRPSLFVEDFQFVAMVVCLAAVTIASKLEAQVPYVHLANLLHDYLQRPMAVPAVKGFVVRTESELLQLVGWDALQPAQISLSVMERLTGILRSDHSVHADALIHFVNRIDDSLMHFAARHRTGGTASSLRARQELQRLRTMSVEEFMLQDTVVSASAEEALVQIVVNSPCVIFPLVAIKAAAQLLRMEHSDALHVLRFMSVDLTEEQCMYFGHVLEEIAMQGVHDLMKHCDNPIDILPDFAYAMQDRFLTTATVSKFLTGCIQASTKFLVTRLRQVCGPQPRKAATGVAALGSSEHGVKTLASVSPPRNFIPPAIPVSPPCTMMAQPQLLHQVPLQQQQQQQQQLQLPQARAQHFCGQKMQRAEHFPSDYDQQPSCKRFCGPTMFSHTITSFTPSLQPSPTGITTTFSAPDEEVAEYAPVYHSMGGVVFNDLSFHGQPPTLKASHMYPDMPAPHTSLAADGGMPPVGFQQPTFHQPSHHSFFLMQGLTPQYIFT